MYTRRYCSVTCLLCCRLDYPRGSLINIISGERKDPPLSPYIGNWYYQYVSLSHSFRTPPLLTPVWWWCCRYQCGCGAYCKMIRCDINSIYISSRRRHTTSSKQKCVLVLTKLIGSGDELAYMCVTIVPSVVVLCSTTTKKVQNNDTNPIHSLHVFHD